MVSPTLGGSGMLGFAGTSYALFAVVWGIMCLLTGAVVTDAMLRGQPSPAATGAEQACDASAAEI